MLCGRFALGKRNCSTYWSLPVVTVNIQASSQNLFYVKNVVFQYIKIHPGAKYMGPLHAWWKCPPSPNTYHLQKHAVNIFLRVVPYFGEPIGRVKIQTTSKNSQRYYRTKRLIRDLLSNMPNWYCSWTELARKIKLTDWSVAGNLSNRSSGVQIPRDICTRPKRYLYSAKCSGIIKRLTRLFRLYLYISY